MKARYFLSIPALCALFSAVACSAPASDEAEGGTPEESALVACPEGQFPGYDCSTAGQRCADKCYPADQRPAAFTRFVIDGRAVDSRSFPYDRVVSLDNVQVYGCDLWNFQNPAHQGLSVQFETLHRGAFLASDPADFEDEVEVYAPNFVGPGRYTSDARYRPSDEASAERQTYGQQGACTMDVTADGEGGLKGTFTCEPIASRGPGAAVTLTGEFACPGSAMSPIFSRIPRR